MLAVGTDGQRFGAWVGTRTWSGPYGFGGYATAAAHPIAVSGLAAVRRSAYVTASDGNDYGLWESADGTSWSALPLPAAAPAGGDAWATVEAGGDDLLAIVDDGSGARAFIASVG